MADTTQKMNVIDESGLDTLLASIFSNIATAYVNNATFESKVQEILKEMPSNNGVGFVSFNIRESDGHLIMSYTGDEVPNARINEEGHLIITF